MDVTAGILGIQAEIAQNKVYEGWNENSVRKFFVKDLVFFFPLIILCTFDR